MNTDDYRKWLQAEIERRHDCQATYLRTIPVHLVYGGKTIWPPEVEVFALSCGRPPLEDEFLRVPDFPFPELAYAWGTRAVHLGIDKSFDGLTRYVIVLGLPPVDSAQKAVEMELVNMEKEIRELAKAFHKAMDEYFSTPFPSTN